MRKMSGVSSNCEKPSRIHPTDDTTNASDDDEADDSTKVSKGDTDDTNDSEKKNPLKYLFRAHIPIEILYDVLEKICIKKDKYYIIDFNAFRLLQFHNLFSDFAETIKPAYKPSKQKYVSRQLTYNSFVTIVRHICRINGIPYETKFNYQHSLYNIDYYIYYTHPTTQPTLPIIY